MWQGGQNDDHTAPSPMKSFPKQCADKVCALPGQAAIPASSGPHGQNQSIGTLLKVQTARQVAERAGDRKMAGLFSISALLLYFAQEGPSTSFPLQREGPSMCYRFPICLFLWKRLSLYPLEVLLWATPPTSINEEGEALKNCP